MNLKSIVENIRTPRIKDSRAGLSNSAKAELYFRQSYQGRFLFELIQNVRDANKISNVLGNVYINLDDDVLTVANSGSPFNEQGINSITMIGDSTKESLDFIRHKGIGFKSIYEISDNPEVITQWGTIEFSKEKTQAVLGEKISNLKHIPLFFVPHYSNNRLSEDELTQGIVTKIVLPLKTGVSKKFIEAAFEQLPSSSRSIWVVADLNCCGTLFSKFINMDSSCSRGTSTWRWWSMLLNLISHKCRIKKR